MTYNTFELGDFALQKGAVLPDAKLGYLTLGKLSEAKDNAIVCPTWFTAKPLDVAQAMTGQDRTLDPTKYFIIIPNHFGAAVSSSPSNTPPPFEKARFPHVTVYDNIKAQHRLVTEAFGIKRLRLVSCWSMGACQTYAWAALHPEMVAAAAPISGSARTAHYNKIFLEGLRRAIMSDPDW
ncbi:MAG: alpha/beta fold hydrolase, partial [Halothiobacillus sp.]|nr:alpha/beta fold hydrolase [Halothiobacillus sp.]